MGKAKFLLNAWAVALALSQAAPSAGQFTPLATGVPAPGANADGLELVKRQDTSCPANTYHCAASLGAAFNDTCCLIGEECAYDVNNKPACCPAGNFCTGTAPANRPLATANLTAGALVANPYFPFPYIATSFDNARACSSAVGVCSRNSQACVSQLAGATFSVSIEVPGIGGTTVAPSRATAVGPSAAHICASLSIQACFGLDSSDCVGGAAPNGIQIGSAWMRVPPSIMAAIPCILSALLLGI